jgi:hypothetical protein
VAQTLPQVPQLASSVRVLVQIALAPVPQTSGLPGGQIHPPKRQPPPAAQTLPQPPQFAGSSFSLVQNWLGAVPHKDGSFTGQRQSPVVQLWPTAHTVPQVPQLFGSCERLAQYGPELPVQATKPASVAQFSVHTPTPLQP